jgi:ABC-type transport system involved in cytochrome bd biosynthesis fused ATPase/permease subunit
MKPSIQTIRAIAVEFFIRVYKPVVVITYIFLGVLLALSIWLTTLNGWWGILLGLVILAILIASAALIIIQIAIRFVRPFESKTQKKQAKALVEKMLSIAEVVATPKVMILFQVAKDIIAPSSQGYIASIGQNTTSIGRDIAELRNSFK